MDRTARAISVPLELTSPFTHVSVAPRASHDGAFASEGGYPVAPTSTARELWVDPSIAPYAGAGDDTGLQIGAEEVSGLGVDPDSIGDSLRAASARMSRAARGASGSNAWSRRW